MIKALLQVQSSLRPTCDSILAMDIVKKRMHLMKSLPTSGLDSDDFDGMSLMNTIKVPKNLA